MASYIQRHTMAAATSGMAQGTNSRALKTLRPRNFWLSSSPRDIPRISLSMTEEKVHRKVCLTTCQKSGSRAKVR